MKTLTLAILLMCGQFTFAQSATNWEHSEQISAILPASMSELTAITKDVISPALKSFSEAPSGKAGQTMTLAYIGLCSGYNIGAATCDIKLGNTKVKATGLEYHIEMGFDMHYGMMSADSRITAFSLQLAYIHFNAKDSYTDTLGKPHENKFKASYFGIPLSYTGIWGANAALGFYFQLGVNAQILISAKDGDTKVNSSFKSVAFLPYGSLGLAIPNEGKHKIRLLGAYVSSTMGGNLSSDNNVSFNCLNYGLRYYSMLSN